MRYRFGACRFDTDAFELRVDDRQVAIEPQVFALLQVFVESGGKLLSKDDLIDQVWAGRIVSDAAIASRIKSVRQAIGDDGDRQAMIATLPKRGYRFVAPVEIDSPTRAEAPVSPPPIESSRPVIAVLPFQLVGASARIDWLPGAMADEIIVELSRLRWLFVIARGSSFRFTRPDAAGVRRTLGASYCLTGRIALDGPRVAVTVELADTRSGGVVWCERYARERVDLQTVSSEIAQAVAAALDLHIPVHEALLGQARPIETLDAWALFHLGLRDLYQFDRAANARAAGHFERAIALSPGFARAHAGLSFARFEDSFLGFSGDAADARLQARRSAERAMERDPLDPFCNLVMGRALWLQGDLENSGPWLERSISLSPNYAQARYARGLTTALLGEADESAREAAAALRLSPLDPLAYGMIGVRALACLSAGDPVAAASWAERAARMPGAHALIDLIAAISHELAGEPVLAMPWAASALARYPGLTSSDFMQAFPFRDGAIRRWIGGSLSRLGLEA